MMLARRGMAIAGELEKVIVCATAEISSAISMAMTQRLKRNHFIGILIVENSMRSNNSIRAPFSKFSIQGNFHRHEKTWNRRQNHPDEKMLIAEILLQSSTPHSRQHYAKGHETGANRVMRRRVFAARDVNQIKHKRRETKTVAK